MRGGRRRVHHVCGRCVRQPLWISAYSQVTPLPTSHPSTQTRKGDTTVKERLLTKCQRNEKRKVNESRNRYAKWKRDEQRLHMSTQTQEQVSCTESKRRARRGHCTRHASRRQLPQRVAECGEARRCDEHKDHFLAIQKTDRSILLPLTPLSPSHTEILLNVSHRGFLCNGSDTHTHTETQAQAPHISMPRRLNGPAAGAPRHFVVFRSLPVFSCASHDFSSPHAGGGTGTEVRRERDPPPCGIPPPPLSRHPSHPPVRPRSPHAHCVPPCMASCPPQAQRCLDPS